MAEFLKSSHICIAMYVCICIAHTLMIIIIIIPLHCTCRVSQQEVVSIKDVVGKCVYLDLQAQMGKVFISLLPNATELE